MEKFYRILNLFNFEKIVLKKNINKELNFLFSLSLKDYFSTLFFPLNMNFLFKIIRILSFFPIIRFIYDFFIFFFTILFNFYFLFFERFFDFLKNFFIILLEEGFFLEIIIKIINFFSYIFLFMFFVNLNKDLQKKRIKLWVYILEFFADILIYIFRTRIKWRYIFYPIIKIFEIFFVFLNILICILACFIDFIIIPIIEFLYNIIIFRFILKISFYKLIFKYNNSGIYYLNYISLLQISTMLQKNGFIAPVCKNKLKRIKSRLSYWKYRRKYIYSELTPDIVDSKALDIYIYLNDLLKNTRYQRKNFEYFGLLRVLFPFSYIMEIYFFLINFLRGIIYLIYIFFLPFILFCVFLLGLYMAYEFIYYYYCLFFKDPNILISIKTRQVRYNKVKKWILNIYKFFFDKFKFLIYMVIFPLILNFLMFRKVYEKIFR